MSKISKLKNNPKLFFKDSYKKRKSQLEKITSILLEKDIKSIPETPKSKDKSVKIKPKISKPKEKPIKKPVASGYRYYLENYNKKNIQKNLVLFDSFWGRKIGCHPYAIYRAMKSSREFNNYKFIWVREEGIKIPEDVLNDSRVSFVSYSTTEYALALLKAEILISNSNFAPYFSPKPDQYVVSTWHGIPMKTLGYDANNNLQSVYNTQRNFNISDLIVSSSEFYADKVVKSYGSGLAYSAISTLGSPRIDLMLNADANDIKEKLGINIERKVILYAPTWRGKIGEVSNDINIQVDLIKYLELFYSEDYEILVSLHHLTKKSLGDTSKFNIKEVPSHIDINEILSVCDIVISDYSSIYLDYLCLDRPVILYVPDIADYTKHRGLYLSPYDLPVNIANNLEELARCIDSIKKPSDFDSYSSIIEKLLPYEDGGASQRTIEKILIREKNNYQHLSDKQNILISVGGLNSSGITKSLTSLLDNIDYNNFNIFLLINAKLVDANIEKQVNLHNLNEKAQYILTIAPKNFSEKEKIAYQNLSKGDEINDTERYHLDVAFSREMRRLIGKFEFDHVIDYTGYSVYWTCCMSSALAGNKIIFQHSDMLAEAENEHRGFHALYGVFQKYRYFDKIVCVSPELLQINRENFKEYVSEDKFYCLPNLLVVSRIEQYSKESLIIVSPDLFLLNMESDIIKFVCVARLSPEKGHALLLHSFKKVVDAGINAILSIVGSGPEEQELKKLARYLGIENRVIFHGYVSNPYAIIRNSNCLVLVSSYEGQGLVYLESMTLGVPCIGGNIPVVKNLITPYGGVVTELNEDSISKAMIDFAESSNIKINFDAEAYVKDSLNILYRNILKA